MFSRGAGFTDLHMNVFSIQYPILLSRDINRYFYMQIPRSLRSCFKSLIQKSETKNNNAENIKHKSFPQTISK